MTDIHVTEGFDEYHIGGKLVQVVSIDRRRMFPVLAVDEGGNQYNRYIDGTTFGHEQPILKMKPEETNDE